MLEMKFDEVSTIKKPCTVKKNPKRNGCGQQATALNDREIKTSSNFISNIVQFVGRFSQCGKHSKTCCLYFAWYLQYWFSRVYCQGLHRPIFAGYLASRIKIPWDKQPPQKDFPRLIVFLVKRRATVLILLNLRPSLRPICILFEIKRKSSFYSPFNFMTYLPVQHSRTLDRFFPRQIEE